MKSVMGKMVAGMVLAGTFGVSQAAVSVSEVVTLPGDVNLGGGDKVGSQLIAATYNAGKGPGVWIVADGGYRLYHNGSLLAEDNQAGRVRFIPMTLLPGENAFSVVGVNGAGAPGVMVQIDDLDRSYYSGGDWKAKPSVGNTSWKNKGRDLSQWGSATTLTYANTKMPSGAALNGFAPNTQSKWIWTGSESDKNAILLFNLNVKAEGFGAVTTGGDKGNIVIAKDSAEVRKYLQSNDAVTILVPEGTYDFRQFRNAVTEATRQGRTWCRTTCGEKNAVTGKTNTFYRIAFQANSCSSLGESGLEIVKESDNLQSWSNWITIKGNKSLIGMGRGANLRGASLNNRWNEGGHNNIYRNLAIYDVNPHLIEAGDGLETSGDKDHHIKNFWADHISYKWISDGMDMEFVDNATISYTDLDGANEYNCWGTDPYMALVEDAHLTYANNYWHNSYGRVPKVTGETNGSQVHIYNQLVDGNRFFIAGANGHSSTAKAYVRYENSYIKNGNGYLAEWGDNGYVYFSGVTFDNTKQQHRYNGTVTQGVPQAATFNPSYSWEKRTVANLPTDLPKLTGVGGRYGSMPSYNQAFGISKKAAEVKLSAPAANAKYDAGAAVLLTAAKSAGDGSVKSVDFYIGNDKVGSATAAPFQVTASGLSAGVYSAVAVVTDNNGLTHMSEFVTFEVVGETYPEITKCGAGSSSQAINLGEAITDFCYTWTGAETVKAEGFPKGITADIDNAAKKISISGTPTEAGAFSFKVSATSNDSTFSKSGKITVTDPNAPASSSSQEPAEESSSSEVPESSSSESVDPESSSSDVTAIGARMQLSTEAEAGFYRVFDMQGRPLFSGERKPNRMPASRVVVVEYTKANGIALRRYIQTR
ncbi:MAG: Ig-like domain-containing protein [Fibrobacter sp.]|nr:Ig-like domain-containing protein [Fibrobacter sp.]